MRNVMVSPENELSVYSALLEAVDAMLSSYGRAPEAQSLRAKHVAALVLSERRILNSVASFLRHAQSTVRA
eukprot:NODE_5425_length_578_cov_58.355388_g4707_i0.p3 GENE.NODE_5425_length_578_cov_58.355388_g4707_i0~~NODE_5425_length_578_cov_58.355388_g4707_i0.p3  ORF type:complete len:71 (+),score=17.67 NODE_5425_length_578_cov_58.355388_g4707_i0:321-533(+)